MAVSLAQLRDLETGSPAKVWADLFTTAWNICSEPLPAEKVESEVANRDRSIADLDLFVATAGWDLWRSFEPETEQTSAELKKWWESRPPGRAVLVLDALSLREAPWLLSGASQRGYTLHRAGATAAELPAETTPFAKALGFGQRSSLENNGAGSNHMFAGASTECSGLPWRECVAEITSAKDWFYWHHWPDKRVHDLSGPGGGLSALTREAAAQLANEDFWLLIERLATGRRLVITADHGYAASGLFPDTADAEQAQHLRNRFKSGRVAASNEDKTDWVPPIDLTLETRHGRHSFVLGRRKWKSQGGYPTLTHGGLSLLEVAVPFMELSRPESP